MAVRLLAGRPAVSRRLLLALLLLALSLPALAAQGKKKSKFLANYPSLMKFLLFWWCVIVFAVMSVYIIDQLMCKYFGPAKVVWTVERTFGGVEGREAYWAQLVDPTQWSTTHPVLRSADVRMMEVEHTETSAGDEKAVEPVESATPAEHSSQLRPVPLQRLRAGLGFIMRHKEGSGPLAGAFFCARECLLLEVPADDVWRMRMRTIEAGCGYPFLVGTEESEVEIFPSAEDGKVLCRMRGRAEVSSRCFRWWTKLQPASRQGAEAMLEAIGQEVETGKKRD